MTRSSSEERPGGGPTPRGAAADWDGGSVCWPARLQLVGPVSDRRTIRHHQIMCESVALETLFCCCQLHGGGLIQPHTCKRLVCSIISVRQAVYEPGVFTTCRPTIEHLNYLFFSTVDLCVADTYCCCLIGQQAGLITH